MIEYEIKSSNLKAIGYDPAIRGLKVTFRSGASYFYDNVTPDLVCGLMFSESAGGFFAKNIKDKFEGIKEGADPK